MKNIKLRVEKLGIIFNFFSRYFWFCDLGFEDLICIYIKWGCMIKVFLNFFLVLICYEVMNSFLFLYVIFGV